MNWPDEQRKWMLQWRRAALALAEVHRQELAVMSEGEALAAAERVLSSDMPPVPSHRRSTSGLVEQQRLFQQRRK